MSVIPLAKVLTTLRDGTLELKGRFLLGSNAAFLASVRLAGIEMLAVYKPQRGEQPLWDFPPASLARREVAAYLVSEALDFGFVPPIVLRDGPLGPGSLQQFIEYNPRYHYFAFKEADRQRLRPVALFDLLINNADRKGSHLLIQKRTRRLFAIDHGLCFHEEDKLRTVLWDFAGEAIPADLLGGLRLIFEAGRFRTSSLRSALEAHLTSAELAALEQRAAALLAQPVFPSPPSNRRAYPFPPL